MDLIVTACKLLWCVHEKGKMKEFCSMQLISLQSIVSSNKHHPATHWRINQIGAYRKDWTLGENSQGPRHQFYWQTAFLKHLSTGINSPWLVEENAYSTYLQCLKCLSLSFREEYARDEKIVFIKSSAELPSVEAVRKTSWIKTYPLTWT